MLSFFTTRSTTRMVSRELTASEELREEVRSLERQVRENPEMFVVMAEFTARSCRDEAIREMLARMDYGWRSRIAAMVMRGHRDGTIRADLDPHRAASVLTSLMRGMCNQEISGLDQPNFGAVADEVTRWVKPE